MKLSAIEPKQEKRVVNFLLFIIYIIALYPLTKIGFTVGDDIDLYVLCTSGRWPEVVGDLPYIHGRFYFFITRWIYALPYLIDSPLYFSTLYILPIALCFVAFAQLVNKLFNNSNITLLSSLLLISTFQIMGFHSSTTSYPFYFTSALAMILFAFSLMLSYYNSNKKFYLFLSSLLMFFASLYYETFLIYYLVFPVLALWKRCNENKALKQTLFPVFKDLIPYLIFGAMYLIAYFGFKHFYPPQYAGLQIAENLSPIGILDTIYNLTLYALPLQVYFDYRHLITTPLLSLTNILFFVSSLLIATLTYLALIRNTKIKSKTLILLFFIGILFALLPQSFIAITKKYYLQELKNYVPTFFSFFAYTISIISIILLIKNLLEKYPLLKKTYIIFLSLLVFFTAFQSQRLNNAVGNDIKLSTERLTLVKRLFKEKPIQDIDKQIIYLGQAHNTTSSLAKWATLQSFNWKDYVYKISEKNIDIYDNYQDLYVDYREDSTNVWVVYFVQDQYLNKSKLLLTQIRGDQLTPKQKDIVPTNLIEIPLKGVIRQIPTKEIHYPIQTWDEKEKLSTAEEIDKLNQIINNIKNDSNWYSQIKKKSKEKNISLKRQLREDAQWVLSQEKQ
ncbi:hypothetical protein SDC9_34128 [bioreactor metagenome]|uniref:Glycosyltransferase RgtA/B/C/D-like domain-containing protein n=1 Tax=bioreactor metagenome TaxID=1076179 RepID=A0A644VBG9_9ZZZZ